MNANRETVNRPVGIDKHGDIYIVRDFFKYADGFQGVTGDAVRAVEMREIDDACEDDNMAEYLRDAWVEAVRAEMTDDSLADWIDNNVPLDEYIDMRFEPANVDVEALHALTGGIGDVVRYEVIGCGRVFGREIEWARVFDADLLARVSMNGRGTDMTINSFSAKDAIKEHLDYAMPEDEDAATGSANDALHEYIDGGLIYYRDILELWDGYTHAEVYFEGSADIMSLITQSTYFQLREEWDWTIYDAIDAWLDEHPAKSGREDWADLDRADRFDAIANT